MAITTYTELKTAVASWLHRSDLTSQIPDFIVLCEEKLNRLLRTSRQETRATASISGEYLALPTDFLAVRNVQLNGSRVKTMRYVSPESIDQYAGQAGEPGVFTIVADQFQFARIGSGTVEIVYWAKITPLSGSVATNWVLTNYPSAYLYGSLLEAAPYLKDDQRIEVWGGGFRSAIESIRADDRGRRFAGTSLVVRSDVQPLDGIRP